jgi:tRNA threonylcarbamoyladenosine modification (KEOPS) complex Cgi121 subunit|tara:strand:+ start:620 stop:1177 length:558 start_codon:yes stop_codon:yes gene_type:complete
MHNQLPWFPAWGLELENQIIDTGNILTLFNECKPDNRWSILAFEAAASEKHLWTAWYSTRRNQEKDEMIAKTIDAEFIRLIAGTHQVRVAFSNAGIRNGDQNFWIIRLPEYEIGDKIDDVLIDRDSYNNFNSEANILIERMNGKLMCQRPMPTITGLNRIGYNKEINNTHSLEECFILHMISAKI